VNWYTFSYVRKITAIIMLEILHTTVTNLVAWDLWTLILLCITMITASIQKVSNSAPKWIWYNKYSLTATECHFAHWNLLWYILGGSKPKYRKNRISVHRYSEVLSEGGTRSEFDCSHNKDIDMIWVCTNHCINIRTVLIKWTNSTNNYADFHR
jgi:hypothetical protein